MFNNFEQLIKPSKVIKKNRNNGKKSKKKRKNPVTYLLLPYDDLQKYQMDLKDIYLLVKLPNLYIQ